MFLRYVKAVLLDRMESSAYRNYIADTLFYQAQKKALKFKYRDIIKFKPVDHRSGDEIALDVIERLDIKIISSEEVVLDG